MDYTMLHYFIRIRKVIFRVISTSEFVPFKCNNCFTYWYEYKPTNKQSGIVQKSKQSKCKSTHNFLLQRLRVNCLKVNKRKIDSLIMKTTNPNP